VAVTDRWFTAPDGTRLYARDEGPLDGERIPVLCLPGLTRHSRDFDPVFDRYAAVRRVIAMDFRGRGRSAKAADPMTYRVDVELQDTLGFLNQLEVSSVALLGTSRGGIVGMLMAAYAKPFLAGLMLNDIGCELQTDGLQRIKDYVGHPVCYKTWDDVAKALAASSHGFSNLSHDAWLVFAKRIYVETPQGICPSHDPRLSDTLPSDEDIKSGKVGELWSVLPALHDVPFALLRGQGSDLLTVATVSRMQKEAPGLIATTVADRGHVPFLDETDSVAAIDAWLLDVDQQQKGQ
jgi:pimeloyl-ACP methyl ester carboxylesterase